jgi:membrane-anchored protein YejM (alkaline phosphatase superfamily)
MELILSFAFAFVVELIFLIVFYNIYRDMSQGLIRKLVLILAPIYTVLLSVDVYYFREYALPLAMLAGAIGKSIDFLYCKFVKI